MWLHFWFGVLGSRHEQDFDLVRMEEIDGQDMGENGWDSLVRLLYLVQDVIVQDMHLIS